MDLQADFDGDNDVMQVDLPSWCADVEALSVIWIDAWMCSPHPILYSFTFCAATPPHLNHNPSNQAISPWSLCTLIPEPWTVTLSALWFDAWIFFVY